MHTLSIATLGSVQVELDGEPQTDFRTRKVQALLIYLATEPEAHSRDKLLNLFWPGLTEKTARANLRQILYYLRQALPEADGSEPAFIIANRQTIRLNTEAAVTVDGWQLEEAMEFVQRHEHLDLFLCQTCARQLKLVVDLYRDDFLTDFYLEDSSEFEEWAQARREYFRRRVLDALHILGTVALREGDYGRTVAYAQRQLDIDNLRESAYRQQMEALALGEQREQALSVYERCRRVLAEELGMAPSARTTTDYERIVSGDLRFDRQPQPGVRGYELKEALGEGSFGAVYRAVQPSIAREVAVKVVRRRYVNDPDFIRRFEAEAQTVARLEHPYIVPLYDYWRDPAGAYMVMRYMRGGSLLTALEDGPWQPVRAAAMLEQIAGALASAHQAGVVHRDIKPGNILLDPTGNAYLADFGIAKDLKAAEKLTEAGAVMGTLDYISPEQITGEPLTPQADIYSLGPCSTKH
ncbi:MAG: protein kinase [Candidatus Promineifilaceae bacterium]|nr:protein kinase [Candidatus Promineifilaceae bacterium]